MQVERANSSKGHTVAATALAPLLNDRPPASKRWQMQAEGSANQVLDRLRTGRNELTEERKTGREKKPPLWPVPKAQGCSWTAEAKPVRPCSLVHSWCGRAGNQEQSNRSASNKFALKQQGGELRKSRPATSQAFFLFVAILLSHPSPSPTPSPSSPKQLRHHVQRGSRYPRRRDRLPGRHRYWYVSASVAHRTPQAQQQCLRPSAPSHHDTTYVATTSQACSRLLATCLGKHRRHYTWHDMLQVVMV